MNRSSNPYHPWDEWCIYLNHLVDFYAFHVGKYTSPMGAIGTKGLWNSNAKMKL